MTSQSQRPYLPLEPPDRHEGLDSLLGEESLLSLVAPDFPGIDPEESEPGNGMDLETEVHVKVVGVAVDNPQDPSFSPLCLEGGGFLIGVCRHATVLPKSHRPT